MEYQCLNNILITLRQYLLTKYRCSTIIYNEFTLCMSQSKKLSAKAQLQNLIQSDEYKQVYESERRKLMVLAQMQDAIEKHGLTQAQVAERMGVAQGDLSKIINGKKPNFSSDMLFRFFDAVGEKFVYEPKALSS